MLIHSVPIHENFPQSMKEKEQWTNYIASFEKNSRNPRLAKVTKCPFDPISRRKINALDPKNFLTIEQAISRSKIQTGTIGIGFVLTGEPFCFDSDGMPLYLIGLDIDRKCRLSSGVNLTQIKKLFSGTYWEKSPSGFGWRAFCLSRKKITNRNKDGFEIYISRRFLTMTGAHSSGDVIDCTNEIEQLFNWYFNQPPSIKRSPIKNIQMIESEKNIATIKTALSFIDPDCDYETYRSIVWAIKSSGWSCADALVEEWSKGAIHRFEENTLQTLLNSFDPSKGITLGTLLHKARLGGYKK